MMMSGNDSLPKRIPDKLPGTVCKQYVKCGKPWCHCARGELHGPYWYRLWRDEEGKLHKAYVRQADLEAVRAACAARQAEEEEVRWALRLGEDAMPWMMGACEVPLDTDEYWEHVWDYPRVLDVILEAGRGHMGTSRMQLRAFKLMGWVLVGAFRPRPPVELLRLMGLLPVPQGSDVPDDEELIDNEEAPVDEPARKQRPGKQPPGGDQEWRQFITDDIGPNPVPPPWFSSGPDDDSED